MLFNTSFLQQIPFLTKQAKQIVKTPTQHHILSKQRLIELLQSSNPAEVTIALQQIINMLISGKDVKCYLPNYSIKKLCSYYISFCQQEQELLLLIQQQHKQIQERNQIKRWHSLRQLGNLHLQEISPILLKLLATATSDLSILVRKCVPIGVIKLQQLDDSYSDQSLQILNKLLKDSCMQVFGPTLHALNILFPNHLELLHPHFNKILTFLNEFEEPYIPSLLDILHRYAIQFLDKRLIGENKVDRDLYNMLQSCEIFLYHSSSAVVYSALLMFFQLSTETIIIEKVIPCLFRFIRFQPPIQFIYLKLIKQIVPQYSTQLAKYQSYFHVKFNEPAYLTCIKLEIFMEIVNESTALFYLKQLMYCARQNNQVLQNKAINLVPILAQKIPSVHELCVRQLLSLIQRRNDVLIPLQKLLQAEQNTNVNSQALKSCVNLLIKNQDINQKSKASILWILCQQAEIIPHASTEAFRKLIQSFLKESLQVKLFILHLGFVLRTKVKENIEIIEKLNEALLELASLDMNPEVQNLAQVYQNIPKDQKFLIPSSKQKPIEQQNQNQSTQNEQQVQRYQNGTISQLLNYKIKYYDTFWNVNEENIIKQLKEDTSELRTPVQSYLLPNQAQNAQSYTSETQLQQEKLEVQLKQQQDFQQIKNMNLEDFLQKSESDEDN